MKKIFLVASALAALTTAAQAESWNCTAPGIRSGSYDGGSMAYIHLASYPDGGTYSATRNGGVATGTTKDGTKFTCRLKK